VQCFCIIHHAFTLSSCHPLPSDDVTGWHGRQLLLLLLLGPVGQLSVHLAPVQKGSHSSREIATLCLPKNRHGSRIQPEFQAKCQPLRTMLRPILYNH